MLGNKRIIVTGAAQGIGAALAFGFAEMGARVVLADIQDPAEAADRIREQGGTAVSVTADVTLASDCARMVDAAEGEFGGLDGLVCNAALFAELPLESFDRIDETLWDRVMAVNAKGPWLGAKAAVPAMTRCGGGSIVMIGTNRMLAGYPGLLHYDASKGAVLAMARSLIRELGPMNIRVNTILPGLTFSEGVRARDGIVERADRIAKGRSLGRNQHPEDLVGPTAFFLSDYSGFVTGQSLVVDGGGIVQ